MLKKIYIIFLLLVSVDFFSLNLISLETQKAFEAFAIISLIFFNLKKTPKKSFIQTEFSKKISTSILIIMIGVFLSSFSALYFYNQSLQITLIAQRSIYFYLLYYYLYKYNIDIRFLQKLVVILGLLFSSVYFLTMVYPEITSARVIEERGTLRISLPGIIFIIVGLFYSLEKVIKLKDYVYLLIILIFSINIIVTGTRVIIAVTFFVVVLYILNSFIQRRVFASFLIVFIFISGSIIFYDIINFVYDLFVLSLTGYEGNVQIRLYALMFYFNNLFVNDLAFFFGNGFASQHSDYGLEILQYKEKFGLFQSDIGIIGDYIKFGAIYLFGIVFLAYHILKRRIFLKNSHLLYSFYFILLSSITISNFGVLSHIPVICIILYQMTWKHDNDYTY